MPDRSQHPLNGHQRHGLNNLNEGFADTLDSLTQDLADVLGDLGQGLIDFLNRLTADDKEKTPTEAEKKDAYAKVKVWESLAANDEKGAVLGKTADLIKGQIETTEQGVERESPAARAQDAGFVRERFIEVPVQIKALPEYELLLAQQRQALAQEQARQSQGIASGARLEAADARQALDEQQQRHEARQDPATAGVEGDDFDPYLLAADQLDAKTLEQGQEIEGEVVEIVKSGDENYYVLEHEGERLAVPAGDEPEHEVGDEIIATRTREGFEIEDAYGYNR